MGSIKATNKVVRFDYGKVKSAWNWKNWNYKHSGVLQKSCVGHNAGKRRESAVYCLKILQLQFKFYSNRERTFLEPLAVFAYVVRLL